jgi:hypothetical protein
MNKKESLFKEGQYFATKHYERVIRLTRWCNDICIVEYLREPDNILVISVPCNTPLCEHYDFCSKNLSRTCISTTVLERNFKPISKLRMILLGVKRLET